MKKLLWISFIIAALIVACATQEKSEVSKGETGQAEWVSLFNGKILMDGL